MTSTGAEPLPRAVAWLGYGGLHVSFSATDHALARGVEITMIGKTVN